MRQQESLEERLVLAGLDALRETGGETLVELLVGQSREAGARPRGGLPIDGWVRYRDAAMDLLQERFGPVAFQTGRILIRKLHHRRLNQIKGLIAHFGGSNRLSLIGQGAVLGMKGTSGTVRASMKGESLLLITIEDCPECRGLRRNAPVCFVNQGVITEFARSYLGLRVRTRETQCIAMEDPRCEIEVAAIEHERGHGIDNSSPLVSDGERLERGRVFAANRGRER